MNVNFHWHEGPHEYPWNEARTFPAFCDWLTRRANSHTDWLDDHSKYVDVRFDSRTGCYVVTHEHRNRYLIAEVTE